jgi:hypothetical protein
MRSLEPYLTHPKSPTIHYSQPPLAQHRGIARKHPFPNVVSFRHIVYRLASIPLPRLRAGICISSRDVIARRLLQSIGLRLRALRIELFAKLALAAL